MHGPVACTPHPNRKPVRRHQNDVQVVCGTDRQSRKRVRAVQRLFPAKRLHSGRNKFRIDSDKSMQRFQGGQCIPGMHPLFDVPAGRAFRCAVCRVVGTPGHHGVKKNLRQPPRAKFTCQNEICGGIAMCSAECYNIWHFHSDVLNK